LRSLCCVVGQVYRDLSTNSVLTMEFISGVKVNNIPGIRSLGLDPLDCATTVASLFARQTFCHGFVHCDPHPGNLIVRRRPVTGRGGRPVLDRASGRLIRPVSDAHQIVLLDHGLYRELSEEFRLNYCRLWWAMIVQDEPALRATCDAMGIGKYYAVMPLVFTYRSVGSRVGLGDTMTREERHKLAKEMKYAPAHPLPGLLRPRLSPLTAVSAHLSDRFQSATLKDINEFLESLPRDMLFVLRTNNLVRSLNYELGGTTRQRFRISALTATQGLRFKQVHHSYRPGKVDTPPGMFV
jgi:aarF domain-containing kinase